MENGTSCFLFHLWPHRIWETIYHVVQSSNEVIIYTQHWTRGTTKPQIQLIVPSAKLSVQYSLFSPRIYQLLTVPRAPFNFLRLIYFLPSRSGGTRTACCSTQPTPSGWRPAPTATLSYSHLSDREWTLETIRASQKIPLEHSSKSLKEEDFMFWQKEKHATRARKWYYN
jgi:hypothetical protein